MKLLLHTKYVKVDMTHGYFSQTMKKNWLKRELYLSIYYIGNLNTAWSTLHSKILLLCIWCIFGSCLLFFLSSLSELLAGM